ncbi:MAG: fasciclin domain-containing protein, partial [Acidobacteriota bacterium]
ADVVAANSLATVQGQSLNIDTADGVSIGGAKVLATDVMTSNGVIHVIDTVLIPQS